MGLLNKKSDDQLRFERIAKEMGYEPQQKKRKKTWQEVQAESFDTESERLEMSGRALDREDQVEDASDDVKEESSEEYLERLRAESGYS